MNLPLLPMQAVLVEKIWGGHKLAAAGKAPMGGPVLGESWEVADLPGGASTVASGPCVGMTLTEVANAHPSALLGTGRGGRFPLLVKVIDAADDLSVQVHPGPDNAAQFDGAASKDEAWLIVGTDPGARLLHGFVDGVTEDSFRAAVAAGTAHEQLRSVEVLPGDVVRVEPGTFHAIGRGTLLIEVQEPSDTTFRVWDFGRAGLDGNPRPLHIDSALAVGNFGDQPPALARPVSLGARHELLVDAPGYRMERVTIAPHAHVAFELPNDAPVVVMAAAGGIAVRGDSPDPVVLDPLATAVVPACQHRLEITATHGASAVVLAGLGGAALVQLG